MDGRSPPDRPRSMREGREPLGLQRDGEIVAVPGRAVDVALAVGRHPDFGSRRQHDGCQLAPDLLVELDHQIGRLPQELLGVLASLTELLTFVGEPRSRLLDEPELYTDVEK